MENSGKTGGKSRWTIKSLPKVYLLQYIIKFSPLCDRSIHESAIYQSFTSVIGPKGNCDVLLYLKASEKCN